MPARSPSGRVAAADATGKQRVARESFPGTGGSLSGPTRAVWEVVEVTAGAPAHALIRDTADRLLNKTVGVSALLDRARYRRLQERRPGGS